MLILSFLILIKRNIVKEKNFFKALKKIAESKRFERQLLERVYLKQLFCGVLLQQDDTNRHADEKQWLFRSVQIMIAFKDH